MQPLQIKINSAYKSIPANLEFELPVFTVLTGENGSGKTQLFEALKNTKENQILNGEKILENISYVGYGSLEPAVGPGGDPVAIRKRLDPIWEQLQQAQRSKLNQQRRAKPKSNSQSLKEVDCLSFIKDKAMRQLLEDISTKSNIEASKMTKATLDEYLRLIDIPDRNPFSTHVSQIFKAYQINDYDNEMNKVYAHRKVPGANKPLDSNAFIERYGETPWDILDAVLERMQLPYRCNNPMTTKREDSFVFKLIHKYSGMEVNSNMLSSGEKTLMSLALAIFNFKGNRRATDIMILDEPDAPLHPSMSKLMLEILEEDVVKKKGIPVILSTHSLTTIACAPARSIYKLNSENKIPEQTSFEDTMKVLALGIPNLNVSIENRRQVFVESKYDVIYYESLFNIISRIEKFETLPQFLPPHYKDGSNCGDVLKIARTLRDMGNKRVYGLIDRDRKNTSESQIIILGMGRRYAIENYIFEPHLLGLYLIHKSFEKPSNLGFGDCHSYIEVYEKISKCDQELQKLASKVESKIDWESKQTNHYKSQLIGGSSISIRSDIFEMGGHELETLIKNTWHQIKGVASNNHGDSAIKTDVINTVINDFPNLLSKDLIDTLKEIR